MQLSLARTQMSTFPDLTARRIPETLLRFNPCPTSCERAVDPFEKPGRQGVCRGVFVLGQL